MLHSFLCVVFFPTLCFSLCFFYFIYFFCINEFLLTPNLRLKKQLPVMRNREKHIITLCLFEFLSSCCHSYSCYIDWCPYEPGYCLTSPPTFAQIRKINKITAATPALPCTNNTLLTLQHQTSTFYTVW